MLAHETTLIESSVEWKRHMPTTLLVSDGTKLVKIPHIGSQTELNFVLDPGITEVLHGCPSCAERSSLKLLGYDTSVLKLNFWRIAIHSRIFNLIPVASRTISPTPTRAPASLGTSIFQSSLQDESEVIFQNTADVMQSWHLDGFDFWRKQYNLQDAISRSTAQVYTCSWTAIFISSDNPQVQRVQRQQPGVNHSRLKVLLDLTEVVAFNTVAYGDKGDLVVATFDSFAHSWDAFMVSSSESLASSSAHNVFDKMSVRSFSANGASIQLGNVNLVLGNCIFDPEIAVALSFDCFRNQIVRQASLQEVDSGLNLIIASPRNGSKLRPGGENVPPDSWFVWIGSPKQLQNPLLSPNVEDSTVLFRICEISCGLLDASSSFLFDPGSVLSVSRCDGMTTVGLCTVTEGHVRLMQLDASHCMIDLSSINLTCLKNLRYLATFKVDGVWVSQSIFGTIHTTCKSLVAHGLSKYVGLTDNNMAQLVPGCNNLKTINLACCDYISDDALSAIADSCGDLALLQLESGSFIYGRSLKLDYPDYISWNSDISTCVQLVCSIYSSTTSGKDAARLRFIMRRKAVIRSGRCRRGFADLICSFGDSVALVDRFIFDPGGYFRGVVFELHKGAAKRAFVQWFVQVSRMLADFTSVNLSMDPKWMIRGVALADGLFRIDSSIPAILFGTYFLWAELVWVFDPGGAAISAIPEVVAENQEFLLLSYEWHIYLQPFVLHVRIAYILLCFSVAGCYWASCYFGGTTILDVVTGPLAILLALSLFLVGQP